MRGGPNRDASQRKFGNAKAYTPGGGGSPIMGYTGRLRPKGDVFFKVAV